jgi:hypothetical protein
MVGPENIVHASVVRYLLVTAKNSPSDATWDQEFEVTTYILYVEEDAVKYEVFEISFAVLFRL